MITALLIIAAIASLAYVGTYAVSNDTCQRVCDLAHELSWGVGMMVGTAAPFFYMLYILES